MQNKQIIRFFNYIYNNNIIIIYENKYLFFYSGKSIKFYKKNVGNHLFIRFSDINVITKLLFSC